MGLVMAGQSIQGAVVVVATMPGPFKPVKAIAQAVQSPEDLFSDLHHRDENVRGLLSQQADIVRTYQDKFADEKDVAFELPTGAGKTLIGLLLAEWRRRTRKERAIYLCLTRQLANQVGEKAADYGIDAVVFTGSKKNYDPGALQAYTRANKVAITTYSSIFNVKPGLPEPDFIILDDAHAADSYVASMWSVIVPSFKDEATFRALADVFRDVLPRAFLERLDRKSSDPERRAYELVPAADFASRLDRTREILDQRERQILDSDTSDSILLGIAFGWQKIRDHLHACHLYLSPESALLRPISPPSLPHQHFGSAKQRVYMSATIGQAGQLQRIVGVPVIKRIPTPAAFSQRSTGRRFFLFPDASLKAEQYWSRIANLIKERKKALVICRDRAELLRIRDSLESLQMPMFGSEDVEESLESFKASSKGILLVSSRFDGIDLPGDSCRLLVLVGRPDAVNLQERFLLSRLGMKEVLRDRIVTRFTQAVGRCTRDQTDYALIVPVGADILDFCSRSENQSRMHPELLAEVLVGLEQSEGSSVDDLMARADAFLDHGEGWSDIENSIRERRATLATRPPHEIDIFLQEKAEAEVTYGYRLWNGDYKAAAEIAKGLADGVTAGGLDAYRAWWSYLAGAGYALLAKDAGDPKLEQISENYTSVARAAAGFSSWYGTLHGPSAGTTGPTAKGPSLADSESAEGIQETLARLGLRGIRFDQFLAETKRFLGSTKADTFHEGLRRLGEMLGWDAFVPGGEGEPDVVWRNDTLGALVFEAKTDEKPEHGVSKKACTQAKGHIDWAKKRLGLPKDRLTLFVVSGKKKIQRTAVDHADDLYVLSPVDVTKVYDDATAFLRDVRLVTTDAESAAAKEEIMMRLSKRQLDPATISKRMSSTPLSKLPVDQNS
jgi:Rad3-related DNA helicase